MTYQVLARKWRPKNFAQLVGQNTVTQALIHALSEKQLHHAYLFTGTRGVGKTTLARILAKCLNCEQGIVSEPCGQCSTCLEIDEGRFPDLIEVDAASRTRIEDTKELLDNVIYAPVRGRYKIYLIDEVHMLSGHSFNALLKTLEEPPAHIKFIFATTEPARIPITVLSRCLHFNLQPISIPALTKQLETILQSENIVYDAKALHLLAKAGKGSLRDCLSLLEQAIGLGQGQVQASLVADMLGLGDGGLILPLMQALCRHDIPLLFQITSQLMQSGADFDRVLEAVLENLHAVNMMQMVPEAKKHVQNLTHIEDEMLDLHTQLSPEQTQLYYQIALLGKRDLSIMPDQSRAFEMVLLRMMCFQMAPEIAKQPVEALVRQAPRPPLTQPAQSALSISAALPQSGIKPLFSPVAKPAETRSQPQSQPQSQSQPEPASGQTPNWRQLITDLKLTGVLKLLAQNCVIHQWTPHQVNLTLEASQQPFLSADREKQLSEALTQHFKRDIKASIAVSNLTQASPAAQLQAESTQKQQQAQNILAQDQNVQTLIEAFDAKLAKLTLADEQK